MALPVLEYSQTAVDENNDSSTSITVTGPTGITDVVMIASAECEDDGPASITAGTYNSVSMSEVVDEQQSSNRHQVWAIVDPDLGTQTLSFTWDQEVARVSITISFWSGAKQVIPSVGLATNGNTNAGQTSIAVNCTTVEPDSVIYASGGTGDANAMTSGETQINTSVQTSSSACAAGYQNMATAGTHNMDFTFSGSRRPKIVAFAIEPPDSAPSGSGAITLSAPDVVGSGEEEIPGSAIINLDDVSVAGTGSGAESPDGTGDVDLSAVQVAGVAQETINAAGDVDLSAVELAAIAELDLPGAGVITLVQVAVSGVGPGAETSGDGAIVLASLAVSGSALLLLDGSGTIVLDAALVAGSSQEEFPGVGAIDLTSIDVAGVGQLDLPAAGAIVLEAPEIAAIAEQAIEAASTILLDAVTVAAVAQSLLQEGAGDIDLSVIVVEGAGQRAGADVVGSGTLTLPVVVVDTSEGPGYVVPSGYRSARLSDVPARSKTFTVPARVKSFQTPGTS